MEIRIVISIAFMLSLIHISVYGLPTVEKLRMLPIDLQARMMLATGNIDELLVGNAYATEEELKKLYEVLKESSKIQNDLDPTLKMLIEHGIISLDKPVKRLRVILDQNITDVYKRQGAISKEDARLKKKEYKEKLAKRKYPSIAYELAEKIQQKTDKEVRITVPGHTQRGGSPRCV